VIDFQGLNDPVREIQEKVNFWHSRMQSHLSRMNTYADFWRLRKPARSGDLSGFANPQLTESTRATEAIATFLYRAMTSAQPNFQFLSANPYVSEEDLWTAEQVVVWQQNLTQYRRKLLKACRSVSLMGTVIVEEPWWINMPYGESTDFLPRSLLQCAFDPLCYDISLSPWHAVIDYVTPDQLRAMGRQMPDVWDQDAIEKVVSSSADSKNVSPEVMARMTGAGYQSWAGSGDVSSILQLTTYYGILKDDSSMTEWCAATVNDLTTVKFHANVYKRRPFVFGHLTEFELEPYGYGVGTTAEGTQPEMNSNRGRMHDTITFALFNQWLIDRSANIKTSQMKIKPWGGIEVDGNPDNVIKALRPQLEGVNFGLQLEQLMKNEFRATTGATDNLQAMVTQATATESSIAQTEAVRRLSVVAEILSDSLLREHVAKMHENNQTFLDKPFSIAATGRYDNLKVFPADLALDVEVQTKIVTDKDFRPQRNKDLLQFLQVVTSIRSQNPQLGEINLRPFVEEFARSVGMNPKTVWSVIPQLPGMMGQAGGPVVPGVMDRVAGNMKQAEGMRSEAGQMGAMANSAATQELAGAA
jgi:hypothetical protein